MKPAKIPKIPSEEVVRRRDLTHLPHKSWCPSRVKDRAVDDKHEKNAGEEREQPKPMVQSDPMFLRSEKDNERENLPTGLCMYRMDTGARTAHVAMVTSDAEVCDVTAVEDFLRNESIAWGMIVQRDAEKGLEKISRLSSATRRKAWRRS